MDALQRQLSDDVCMLVWKVMYYAYDWAPELGNRLGKPGSGLRKQFQDRAKDACTKYARSRVFDRLRSFQPQSSFHPALAELMYQVARPGGIFDGGAPDVATEFTECLLRYEGWEVDANSEAAFRKTLKKLSIAQLGELKWKAEFIEVIRAYWQFGGEPDEGVFQGVIDFRQRQGGNLLALL